MVTSNNWNITSDDYIGSLNVMLVFIESRYLETVECIKEIDKGVKSKLTIFGSLLAGVTFIVGIVIKNSSLTNDKAFLIRLSLLSLVPFFFSFIVSLWVSLKTLEIEISLPSVNESGYKKALEVKSIIANQVLELYINDYLSAYLSNRGRITQKNKLISKKRICDKLSVFCSIIAIVVPISVFTIPTYTLSFINNVFQIEEKMDERRKEKSKPKIEEKEDKGPKDKTKKSQRELKLGGKKPFDVILSNDIKKQKRKSLIESEVDSQKFKMDQS